MSQFGPAIEDEYEKVNKLYNERSKARRLDLVNAAFIVLLIVVILLPFKWYTNLILCLPLLLLYGVVRLISLNR